MGSTQRGEVGGDAHGQSAREVAQRPAGQDARPCGTDVAQLALKSELGDQVEGLLPSREEAVGPGVDQPTLVLGGGELPAELRRSLEDNHLIGAVEQELVGSAQPGDAAAEHAEAWHRYLARCARRCTTSASIAVKVESALSERVRTRVRPSSSASALASMSTS